MKTLILSIILLITLTILSHLDLHHEFADINYRDRLLDTTSARTSRGQKPGERIGTDQKQTDLASGRLHGALRTKREDEARLGTQQVSRNAMARELQRGDSQVQGSRGRSQISSSREAKVTNGTTKHTLEPAKISYTTIARFIKRCEGFKARPYRCAAGKLTVGYGTLTNNPRRTVTKSVASALLKSRLQHDYDVLIRYTSRDTALVLCSFAYNCGLRAAEIIAKQRRVSDIRRYIYANHKPHKGLINRRNYELALLEIAR